MINWDLLNVRNILVIGVLSVVAIMIFNHFAKKGE
jgi:hypothetical protein